MELHQIQDVAESLGDGFTAVAVGTPDEHYVTFHGDGDDGGVWFLDGERQFTDAPELAEAMAAIATEWRREDEPNYPVDHLDGYDENYPGSGNNSHINVY